MMLTTSMTFKMEKRHDESCRFSKSDYTVLLEHTLGVLFYVCILA